MMTDHQLPPIGPRLRGKVALIAGSTSGIGATTARLFAQHGAYVAVTGRRVELGEAVVAEIADNGGAAMFLPLDVTEPDSVEQVVTSVVKEFGRLDVMMSNAGGSSSQDGPVTEAAIDEFWDKIKLDLFGTFLCSRFAIPAIIASGGGSVINVSSVVSYGGIPNRDAYTSAKGGVLALTNSTARRYAADGVRVNAIAPATVGTERILAMMERVPDLKEHAAAQTLGLIDPFEIASAALHLASDESRTMTGQTMLIHGGLF